MFSQETFHRWWEVQIPYIKKACLLFAVGKTIYLRCFLKDLDVTENKDSCMFLGVTEKCWFCYTFTSSVNILLEFAMGILGLSRGNFTNLSHFTWGSQEPNTKSLNFQFSTTMVWTNAEFRCDGWRLEDDSMHIIMLQNMKVQPWRCGS